VWSKIDKSDRRSASRQGGDLQRRAAQGKQNLLDQLKPGEDLVALQTPLTPREARGNRRLLAVSRTENAHTPSTPGRIHVLPGLFFVGPTTFPDRHPSILLPALCQNVALSFHFSALR
jgi:hypothetical protein